MDPQTLPEQERELYNAIKKQYKIAFEGLKIGEHSLHLLRMTDLEEILDGKDPLKDVTTFPFWIRLWEAAIVLSQFIAGTPCKPGTKLLELGAGLGAPGLTAAKVGYDVTLSDYEDIILDFERINAAASRLDNVECCMLDWLKPDTTQRYDVILGAEILFREEFFQPLLNVLEKTLKPGGVIYLAHDSNRQSLKPFLQMAEKNYKIAASQKRLKSFEGDKTIILNRLQPRH